MNTRKISRISARFFATGMVMATMLLLASTSPAFGQERSQSRDNPKLLEVTKDGKFHILVEDDLDGSNDEYFYKFSVIPGKVMITFEVKALDGNAGATLDLFDSNSRPILSNVLAQGVDSGSERVVRSIRSGKKQDIIMRIKGIRYGDSGGNGTYRVVLSGGGIIAKPTGG